MRVPGYYAMEPQPKWFKRKKKAPKRLEIREENTFKYKYKFKREKNEENLKKKVEAL